GEPVLPASMSSGLVPVTNQMIPSTTMMPTIPPMPPPDRPVGMRIPPPRPNGLEPSPPPNPPPPERVPLRSSTLLLRWRPCHFIFTLLDAGCIPGRRLRRKFDHLVQKAQCAPPPSSRRHRTAALERDLRH